MKTPKEIEYLAEKEYPLKVVSVMEGYEDANRFERIAFTKAYTQCQENTKQVLLDFIKWANAVDEYGEPLNENDIDNFLNK